MTPATVARNLVRYGAYPAFGLVAFVLALYVTFPYDRLRDRLVQSLQGGPDLDVGIGAIEPTWGGGILLRDVTVRPKGDPEDSAPLKIAETRIGFGLLAALTGSVEANVSAKLLGGELDGEVEHDEEATHVRIETEGLTMEQFPWIPTAIGLPLLGKLEAKVDLTLPKGLFAGANGTLDLFCRGCVLGDGKSKFRVPGATGFMADGVTLPKLRIGDWKGRMLVDKGTARLEGFESKSPDGETGLEGEVALRDPIAQSLMKAYVRFKISDELKRSEPKLDLLDRGLSQGGRRPDGAYGLRISGRLGSMRFMPSRFSPAASRTEPATARPKRPAKPWAPAASSPSHEDETGEPADPTRAERPARSEGRDAQGPAPATPTPVPTPPPAPAPPAAAQPIPEAPPSPSPPAGAPTPAAPPPAPLPPAPTAPPAPAPPPAEEPTPAPPE